MFGKIKISPFTGEAQLIKNIGLTSAARKNKQASYFNLIVAQSVAEAGPLIGATLLHATAGVRATALNYHLETAWKAL